MFKLDLEKVEEPEIKLPTSVGSEKKQGNSRKISTSASLTTLLLCVSYNKLWTILRDGNTRPPYLPPEKPVCRSGSNRTEHGTMNWFKIWKGVCKNVVCVTMF